MWTHIAALTHSLARSHADDQICMRQHWVRSRLQGQQMGWIIWSLNQLWWKPCYISFAADFDLSALHPAPPPPPWGVQSRTVTSRDLLITSARWVNGNDNNGVRDHANHLQRKHCKSPCEMNTEQQHKGGAVFKWERHYSTSHKPVTCVLYLLDEEVTEDERRHCST